MQDMVVSHVALEIPEGIQPYEDVVQGLLTQEFPLLQTDAASRLDAVVADLIGSSQTRYGPRPNAESELAMRGVVQRCMAHDQPIPVLIPAGPKKPVQGMSVDTAELAALRTLGCLQHRISRHYPPGLEIVLRMEDVTGWVLEGHESETRASIARYLEDFETLVHVLGYGEFIFPVRESSLIPEEAMWAALAGIEPVLGAYMRETNARGLDDYEQLASWQQLKSLGWSGEIPMVQREYYDTRYQKLFPSLTAQERVALLIRYFSLILARVRHGATGTRKHWTNGQIQITFAPAIPGTPTHLVSTRVYYRTLPLKMGKHHLPFWRAKGFLKLNGTASFSLASWADEIDLSPCAVRIRNGSDTVSVRTDYLLT